MDIPSVTGASLTHLQTTADNSTAGTQASTSRSRTQGGSQTTSTANSTTSRATDASSSSEQSLTQAVKEVQEALAPVARDLQFSIDKDTGSTVIKIVDTSTDEVIKQIPSDEMLRIAQAIDKLQGVLLNQTA